MDNLDKHIKYWEKSALSDITTALLLIKKKRYPEGLFFCHLSIEKILKAHFVKTNNDVAPRTHNLYQLSERSNISLNDEITDFFGILMKYQVQGRYPDYSIFIPDKKTIKKYYKKAQEILRWLIKAL